MLKKLITHSAADKLATHTTENLLQRQRHWFVPLSAGTESNKAPRRRRKKQIKEVHCTTMNSPFNYFIKWPSELLSDCLAWIQTRGETKWPSLRAGSQHSHSTVYQRTLTLCVCVCVLRCWLQLLGCLCRRQLEVDVATVQRGDNRDPVWGLQTHTYESAHKGHAVSRLCFRTAIISLLEIFMKCWPQKLNNTLFVLVWCPNVCQERRTGQNHSSVRSLALADLWWFKKYRNNK